MNKGTLYAIVAFTAWGVLPVYWKQLDYVPSLELISHRILWSFLFLITIILVSKKRRAFTATLTAPVVCIHTLSAGLLAVNWVTYVWAVNAGFIIESSLGYFITPLINVGLGVLVLKERLRSVQWVAVGLAFAGLLYLTVAYGSFPWIALVLGISFGTYGLVKKLAPLGSIRGLTTETGLLLPPTIVYLIYTERIGEGTFLHASAVADVFLIGLGVVTIIPLLLFASAVQRIPLSLTGILQYIAPTLQFLVGLMVYKEPFTAIQLTGFGMVWAALGIFSIEGLITQYLRPSTVIE